MNKKINDIINYVKGKDAVQAYSELVDLMSFSEDEASDILGVKTFKDLKFEPHSVVPNGVAAVEYFPSGDKGEGGWFSVVGGGVGLYGDGVSTFEVFADGMDNPFTHLSKEQVTNEMLDRQKTKYEL
tara:strand:- start:707 stop:1087 length:381 start_codon:yes stop_codon:yes gene_type:complete